MRFSPLKKETYNTKPAKTKRNHSRKTLQEKHLKELPHHRNTLYSYSKIKQITMNQFGLGDANALAGQLGIAVLVFFCMVILGAIMLLYIRGENRKWEHREESNAKVFESIIAQVSKSQTKDFDLLKQTLDDNREQIQAITRLVDRVKIMQEQSDSAFRDLFATLKDHTKNPCYQKLLNPKQ